MKAELYTVESGAYPLSSARVPTQVVPGYPLVRPGSGTRGGGPAQADLLQVQRVHRVLGLSDGACGEVTRGGHERLVEVKCGP